MTYRLTLPSHDHKSEEPIATSDTIAGILAATRRTLIDRSGRTMIAVAIHIPHAADPVTYGLALGDHHTNPEHREQCVTDAIRELHSHLHWEADKSEVIGGADTTPDASAKG